MILYFINRAVRNYREELGLHLRVVFGFGMMVMVFGGYLLALGNLNRLVERWGSELQVTAYLAPGAEAKTVSAFIAALQKDPAVQTAEFVSPELAMKRFRDDLGSMSGVLDGLPVNPLPASVEIGLRPEARNPAAIKELANRTGRFEIVEEVQYGEGWIDRYDALIGFVELAGVLLGAFLLAITLGAVTNTIQLVIYARKEEIAVLRLVGATDNFIRIPFMLEGMIGGLLASTFGLGCLGLVFALSAPAIERAFESWFGTFPLAFLQPLTIFILVTASMAVGLVSSLVAAHRHIRT